MAKELDMKVEVEQSDISTADTMPLGLSGLSRFGGDVTEDFIKHLQYPRAAGIYQEMSDNDPTIGAVLYMTKQLIKKTGWSVEPASDKQADIDAATFLESCMNDMTFSWDDVVAEILSMIPYGFSFHEIVYKVRGGPTNPRSTHRSKYNDGRIGWSKIPGRAQSSLAEWVFADNGDIKAFVQQAPPHFKKVEIPLSRGLLFRTETTRDNPEGRSMLRNAYRPWYFKKRIEEIEGIGIERDLAGLPVVTTPPDSNVWDKNNPVGVQMKATAEALVRNIRRDRSEGVVLPDGWKLELLSTGGSRQFDTNAIINRNDNRIAITLLSDIVMMGGDKVGSFALGEVKKSLMAASLEAIVQHIADVFNRYAVPRLFSLNYFAGITDLPKIVPGEVETPDLKELAFLLRAAGMDVKKDLPLMNLLRNSISLKSLTQEELEDMYPAAPETSETDELNAGGGQQNSDPVMHSMDDNNQNYEAK